VGYNSNKRKRDTRIGTWNVRSMYKARSLTTEARELARHELDLVGVQEVRWDKEGAVTAGDYNFFSMEKKTKIIKWEPSGSIKCGKFLD
jgi:exonuclease III